MNCRKAQRLTQLRLDGEIDPQLEPALNDHLEICSACRRMANQVDFMAGGLRELAAVTASRDAIPPALTRGDYFRWRIPLAVAASVALFLGASIYVRHLPRSLETPSIPIAHQATPTDIDAPPDHAPMTLAKSTEPVRPQVQILDDSQVIAVPVETANPNLTILRIYPKIQLARSNDKLDELGS